LINLSTAWSTADAASHAKKPIHVFSIEGYSRVFTYRKSGVGGQVDWITHIDNMSTSVSDLDGGADQTTLAISVQDHGGAITADWPTALFEGKKCTLKTGFDGMSQGDFVTVFTGIIDSVDSANENQEYCFNCVDVGQVLSKVIYTVADDGNPTGSDHVKTVAAHPIDILIDILTTQVGLDLTQVNAAKLYGYRDTIFAGLEFIFAIDSPPAAQDFIEQQIMQPLGGYLWVNSLGQFDANFFYPNSTLPVLSASAIGGWADGTGQLVAAPFLISKGGSFKAPAGATQLLMGVNDQFWGDNTGSWTITVNGVPVTVGGNSAPYSLSGGLNTAYTYSTSGGPSAPASAPVTAGGTYVLAVSGTVFLHLGTGPSDGSGYAPDTSGGSRPGDYATPQVTFKAAAAVLDPSNTFEIPLAETAELVNTIVFRFDKTDNGFAANATEVFPESVARFGSFGDGQMNGEHIIESEGARSGFQGFYQASFVARMIFYRYGLKNLQYESVPVSWTNCHLEPGDLVLVTQPTVPDRQNGVVGISNRPMEVLDREYDFMEGKVILKLLDAVYLDKFGGSLIAPDGMADYTGASADNQAKYMFLCGDDDKYSNGDAAHVLG